MKNSKIATIPIGRKQLFYRWLELTKPFHKLPKQQMMVLSWLLFYYDKYKNETNNDEIAWKLVFNYDTKLEIKETIGIKDQTLQNTLSALRKKNIIKGKRIMDNYIPNIESDATEFRLTFNFKIVDEK